jgi:phospholipase/carboxylesterase
MNRRSFLTLSAAGAAGSLYGTRRVNAQARRNAQPPAQAPSDLDFPYGEGRLGLSDDDRDGSLYIPKKYKDGVPMPVLIMLHGVGGSAQSARFTFPLSEEFGVIIMAPESRSQTWEQAAPGYDVDSHYIAAAIKYVDSFLYFDRSHFAIAGVSDGATYALGMGLSYGGAPFTHVMGFSEGIVKPYNKQGKPKVFVAHGVNDAQMPIDRTSRKFIPELKGQGYDVTYREYDGGHGAPAPLVREAFQWFLKDAKPR